MPVQVGVMGCVMLHVPCAAKVAPPSTDIAYLPLVYPSQNNIDDIIDCIII